MKRVTVGFLRSLLSTAPLWVVESFWRICVLWVLFAGNRVTSFVLWRQRHRQTLLSVPGFPWPRLLASLHDMAATAVGYRWRHWLFWAACLGDEALVGVMRDLREQFEHPSGDLIDARRRRVRLIGAYRYGFKILVRRQVDRAVERDLRPRDLRKIMESLSDRDTVLSLIITQTPVVRERRIGAWSGRGRPRRSSHTRRPLSADLPSNVIPLRPERDSILPS